MSTLLIRLVAPLQSWGTQSHFTMRDTGLEPSKSGLIGLICAALGRPRSAPLNDLTKLKMGVRIDRPGIMQKDFQVVQDVLTANGKVGKYPVISNRYYLANAAFLAGLEGDRDLLEEIQHALQKPAWPLYLGRKAFIPAEPVWLSDGLHPDQDLATVLQDCGWLVRWPQDKTPQYVLLVLDDPRGSQQRNDVPLSFAERTFASRRVSTRRIKSPTTYLPEVA